MSLRSIKPNLATKVGQSPAVLTASSAALTTNGVDLVGFDSAMVIVNVGAIVGAGIFNVKLQESDTNLAASWTDVAASDMDIDIATSAPLVTGTVYRLGYLGTKRYINVVFTYVSGTSVSLSATIVKGLPHQAPVAITD